MATKSLYHTLDAPPRLDCIPASSQWLSGEGAGSWFCLIEEKGQFIMIRYSAKGRMECSGIFEVVNNSSFDINKPYLFTHLSHCKRVHIIQDDRVVKMDKVIIHPSEALNGIRDSL